MITCRPISYLPMLHKPILILNIQFSICFARQKLAIKLNLKREYGMYVDEDIKIDNKSSEAWNHNCRQTALIGYF